MMRPRGQGLLGGGIGVAIVLLAAACSGSSDEAAPTPEPTVAIAEAPTPTEVPASEEPTAQPEPTASPEPAAAPEPTAPPEDPVEAQVIAAWERYWDLAVQARGENPPPEALAFSDYVGGQLLEALSQTLVDQQAAGYFVVGVAIADRPAIELRSDSLAILNGCVAPELESISLTDGLVVGSQDDPRLVRGRVERSSARWLVTAVEIGDEPC